MQGSARAGVTEGATRLLVGGLNAAKPVGAPGARRKGEPFYNPGMGLNRDLSVLLVEAFARAKGREIDVADALAGTGARSARLAREVAAPILVHANDGQPEAAAAARATAEANGVQGRMAVHEGDAHVFLASRRFDVVDLDPCGSPMPFADAAMRAVRPGGLVCATATDTGALAGKFPRVCRRRYGAQHGLHAESWRSEVGLRILAGALVRSAARLERGAVPVLSVSRGHWMRVVVRVTEGSGSADAALAGLGCVSLESESLPVVESGAASGRGAWAGPLWCGSLHEAGVVAGMREAAVGKSLAHPREVAQLLEVLAGECGAPPFWFVPDEWQGRWGTPTPRRDALMARLRQGGFRAERTHLDAQGIRTDAPLSALRAAWSAPAAVMGGPD